MKADRARESEVVEDAIYMRIDQEGPYLSEEGERSERDLADSSNVPLCSEDDGPFKNMPNESFHSGNRPSLAKVRGFTFISTVTLLI